MEQHERTSGRTYIYTWVVLLVLTGLTLFLSRGLDLGSARIPVAFSVAAVKGGLVVFYFMHLNEQRSVNRIFFAVAVVFIIVLIALIAADVFTRGATNIPIPPGDFTGK